MSTAGPISLHELRQNIPAMELLGQSFDIGIFLEDEPGDRFFVEPIQGIAVFAREGAGGRFAILESSGHILYVSSEGAAGIVAASFPEFMHLVVACPYWQDLLHFSGNGKLHEMRSVLALLEDDAQDDTPDIDNAREILRREMRLAAMGDPVELLHRAVSDTGKNITVRASDGTAYATLFNHFTLADNPFWRDAVS
jgi:hypothetical protein